MTHLEDVADRLAKQETEIAELREAVVELSDRDFASRGRRGRRPRANPEREQVRATVHALAIASGHGADRESTPRTFAGTRVIPPEPRRGDEVTIENVPAGIVAVRVGGHETEIVESEENEIRFVIPYDAPDGAVLFELENGRTLAFQLKLRPARAHEEVT